jgi:hypothetical protein
MADTNIRTLIEEEIALKNQLKDLRQELKTAIEATQLYQGLLEHTKDIPDMEVNEKTAKAHAYKVTYETFAPPKEEADGDGEDRPPKKSKKKN